LPSYLEKTQKEAGWATPIKHRIELLKWLAEGCELTVSPRAIRFKRSAYVDSVNNCCHYETPRGYFLPTYHRFERLSQPFRHPYCEFYDDTDKLFVVADCDKGLEPYKLEALTATFHKVALHQKNLPRHLRVKWGSSGDRGFERSEVEICGEAAAKKKKNN